MLDEAEAEYKAQKKSIEKSKLDKKEKEKQIRALEKAYKKRESAIVGKGPDGKAYTDVPDNIKYIRLLVTVGNETHEFYMQAKAIGL